MSSCFTCDHIRDYDDYAETVLCNIQCVRLPVQQNCSFYKDDMRDDYGI